MLIQKPYRVLVIDDDEEDFFLIKDYLSELGGSDYSVEWASNYRQGEKLMSEARHDIYLIDYFLGAGTGLELITSAIAKGCRAPKILLTGVGNRELDIEAIRAGADDYLPKARMDVEMLERTIRHAIERYEQQILYSQQQALYKTLFEQSNDPIYVTDENWRFTGANSSFLKLFGFSEESLLQKDLKSIFPEKKEFEDFITRNKDQGFVQNFTVNLSNDSSNKIIALISSSPILNFQRQLTGYQGMIHDITQLKKAEREISLAEKLTMTGRMARMIAHEVRNPLTNIMLAADQLSDGTNNVNEEFYNYSELIKRNSIRINNLISDMLNSTRLAKLNLVKHSIEQVLDDALMLCNDRIKMKGIHVEKKGNSQQTMMDMDPEKLKIAFTNIITNAIEAMENIDKPSLLLHFENAGAGYAVRITDNGKGMDAKTQGQLFDAFFTDRPGGIGLGLTLVQHVIMQHKGSISVQSEPGKGTTFHIELPVMQSA